MQQDVGYQCATCMSALHLSGQQTTHQLHIAAEAELKKLPSVLDVHGFEVIINSPGSDETTIHLQAYTHQNSEQNACHMAKHEMLNKALDLQCIQRCFEKNRWFCFIPIKASRGIRNIWIIEFAQTVDENDLKCILLLAEIFYNCNSHISMKNTDPLTGLQNRQALSDRLDSTLKKKRRARDLSVTDMPSICLLDIDYFKRVNDKFGHLYGDEVLLLFSGLMKKIFREHDFLYRYGGEEFLVLLDTSSIAESILALERFRNAVEAFQFPQVGRVTVSIGVVQMDQDSLPSTLIDRADKSLYYAKEHGRNQVCSYQTLMKKGLIKEHMLNVKSELF